MSAAKYTLTNGGAVLPDDNDPITSPPAAERMFTIPRASTGNTGIWVYADGGDPEFQIWALIAPDVWALLYMDTSTNWTVQATNAVVFPIGQLITDVMLFLRVVAANGATVMRVGTI